jgi:hypothetical protein
VIPRLSNPRALALRALLALPAAACAPRASGIPQRLNTNGPIN